MQKGVLYVEDVAVLFMVNESTVRRWAREEKLSAKKVGRRWVFPVDDLNIIWNTLMAKQPPSTQPKRDLKTFLALVADIDTSDVDVFEEAQQEALDLALGLLPTSVGGAVWEVLQRLRGNAGFGFVDLIPRLVPIH